MAKRVDKGGPAGLFTFQGTKPGRLVTFRLTLNKVTFGGLSMTGEISYVWDEAESDWVNVGSQERLSAQR